MTNEESDADRLNSLERLGGAYAEALKDGRIADADTAVMELMA
jgi:hypothetical protein